MSAADVVFFVRDVDMDGSLLRTFILLCGMSLGVLNKRDGLAAGRVLRRPGGAPMLPALCPSRG